MRVIFLDGESKSGKTAVGKSILSTLTTDGHTARLLVAGSFFRQLTALALETLGDAATDQRGFEMAVRGALDAEALLRPPVDATALESPAVEAMVSRVGELDFVQAAAAEWRLKAAQKALEDGVEILLFDGRNLRQKLQAWADEHDVSVALELVIFCRPEVAAERYLRDEGNDNPTETELAQATQTIVDRRNRDRDRAHAAYEGPQDPVELVVGRHTVDEALAAAFASDVTSPPRPIRFDNSEVPRDDGLRTVTELALKAIEL